MAVRRARRAEDEAAELIEALLPLRDQLPGALSTTLAMQPVALTLGELSRLLGREDEAAAHFAHAVDGRRALGVAALGCAGRRAALVSALPSGVQVAAGPATSARD